MKTYLKTLSRMFTKHVTRFMSIILMVVVAVGFISGIGTAADKVRYSLTDHYKTRNVSDFIIKSTAQSGFTADEISAVKSLECVNDVDTGMSIDVNLNIGEETLLTRIYFLDNFADIKVNLYELIDGNEAENKTQIYAEVPNNKIKGIGLGTDIKLDFKDFAEQLAKQADEELESWKLAMLDRLEKPFVTVCGSVQGPLTFAKDGELSYTNGEDIKAPTSIGGLDDFITLENILYISSDVIPELTIAPGMSYGKIFGSGDMYVTLSDRKAFDAFGIGYKDYLNDCKSQILTALDKESDTKDVRFITLKDNYSFVSLSGYADKVMGIGYVLMVAFLFVTALVVLSTMTRLLEEDRGQLACLRTLGYSSFKILFKYQLFAMLATGIGGVGSYFVGLGLAYLICYVFNYSFAMPPISSHIALEFFLIVFAVIVLTTFFATLIAGHKMTGETPANLLRPKPPKAGKKVFFEKIPFLWNRLSFKYKSTVRNVLRYANRFIMTVVSVAVSTGLVLAGLALLDLCLTGQIKSFSVMAVALVVIVFAGLLTAVVIYTLTNINVSERNRELATLKVLGYQEKEVSSYIYREVYIDTFVGIIFGYPIAAFLIWLVFGVIEMGAVGAVSWYWWLLAPVIVLLFTFIVTILLKRKITRIDMNESLKAVE